MARITICDWCKEKFKELVHSVTIDWINLNNDQSDRHAGHYEVCSGCREEIKNRLDSLEIKKKNTRNSESIDKQNKVCSHNNGQGPDSAWEISGSSGEFLECTLCGEKKKS